MPKKSRKKKQSSSTSRTETCPVCGLKFTVTVSHEELSKSKRDFRVAIKKTVSHFDHFITVNLDASGRIRKIDFTDGQIPPESGPVYADHSNSLVEVLVHMKNSAS
ncbi:MAG: hypothetical protein ACFFD4_16975, partial [Candidatus Odinarchaeota archaeon]